jgi:hypothetical protein
MLMPNKTYPLHYLLPGGSDNIFLAIQPDTCFYILGDLLLPLFFNADIHIACRFLAGFRHPRGRHMDNLRVGKAVRRIIMLRPGPSGTLEPTILYENERKKKKQTRALQPLEVMARRVTNAQRAYWDTLVAGHDRSNEKKRDGWARDGITNIAKASQKGVKQLIKGF